MTLTTARTAAAHRTFRRDRLLQGLLAVYAVLWVALAISPVDREDWLLENLLAIGLVVTLVATYRRFAFSDLSYLLLTVFMILHAIGAHYTYAKVPFGFWLKEVFDLDRNHFDRLVHFAFGLLLAYPVYEVFVRLAKVTPGWALLIAGLAVTSLSGLFEVLEAWVAQVVNPELGTAYLGTQGDEWDAQKDMTMAIIGAVITIALTYAIPRITRTP
ncbi:DUF2238 domain-containing protein [Candidatus Nitrospira bockiana]